MTQFIDPKLATDAATAPIAYTLHQTGSFLIGDLFHSSYITESIFMVENLGPLHKTMLAGRGQELNAPPEQIARLQLQADDLIRWAVRMREEGYHTIHSQVFVSLWAAQETGLENTIAAILEHVRPAAAEVATKFSKGRYDINAWPWPPEICLEIAQKLDGKAKERTSDGGWDAYSRLQTLFGWLGVYIPYDSSKAKAYNVAALARNVVVHRYGRLSAADVRLAPELSPWVGQTLPITRERLGNFHRAIIDVFLPIYLGINAMGWEKPSASNMST